MDYVYILVEIPKSCWIQNPNLKRCHKFKSK